ncbi:FAD-binding domain-containing protein [Whalleya microplaca]|nr:FAD-binding domain-containing protein [Whalleya microplaca]
MECFNTATAVLLLCLASTATATPTASTLQACSDIANDLPDRVEYPSDLEYHTETSKYWSAALREVEPACVVIPTSAPQVASVVQVLNRYSDVQFAVKSGGHDPNPGHATIEDGILISMSSITGATYDENTGLASVGPGGQWNDVIGDLEPHGVTVVGGRLGIVGVGGYLLQGGISFLSAQYGLAADNIVGWETVMANGSIANIDAAAHPDFAVAMRGSGSQFGIVTQFKIQAHPIAKVWGGYRLYDTVHEDDLYAALHHFVQAGAADPKAAIIHTNLIAVGGIKTHVVYYFYDGPELPEDVPFADYLKIPSLASFTSTQSYASLLAFNGASADLARGRMSFRTYTLPYIPSNPGMYAEIRNKWRAITLAHLANVLDLDPTSQCSADFQPFPSILAQRSAARGGNAMGLAADDPDRVILELQCMWAHSGDDAALRAMGREMTDWLDERVPEWLQAAGEEDKKYYLPLFMNDAAGDQNVTGSYRGYERFRALQREVDPEGLFRVRAGGFKY